MPVCYEFSAGKLAVGLTVSTDTNRKVVFLGIQNDRSTPVTVGLDKYNAPFIDENGKIGEAALRNINTKSGTKFKVLQRPMRPSTAGEAIVRICTSGCGDLNSNGSYRVVAGRPRGLFQADGINRTTRFSDDIIIMNPGDKIAASLEGSEDEYILENNGAGIVLTGKPA